MRSQLRDVEAVKEHLHEIVKFIEHEEGRLHQSYLNGEKKSRFPLGAGILRKTGFHLEMLTRDIEQRLRGGG